MVSLFWLVLFVLMVMWMQWMCSKYSILGNNPNVYEFKTCFSFLALFIFSVLFSREPAKGGNSHYDSILIYFVGLVLIFLVRVVSTKNRSAIRTGIITGGLIIVGGVLVGICQF